MKKLIRLFNAVFMAVPLGTALFFALVYFFGGWGWLIPDFGPEHFIGLPKLDKRIVGLLIVIFCVLLLCVLLKLAGKIDKSALKPKTKALLFSVFIFLFAAITRLSVIYLFREDLAPYSDFQRSWELAHGNLEAGGFDYYLLFPSYLNYSVYMSAVIKIFGDSFVNVLYLNTVLSGFIALLIFLTVKKLSSNNIAAFIGGMLYAAFPAEILYNAVNTPEFLTVSFNTAGVLLLVYTLSCETKIKYILSAAAGILIGIGSSYKTFGIIILIAFSMAFAAKQLIRKDKKLLYRLAVSLCSVLLLFAGYTVSKSAVYGVTAKIYDTELDTGSSLPHFLMVGLNTEAEGQYGRSPLSLAYVDAYWQTGQNAEEAKEIAFEALKSDWKNNPEKIPRLFFRKSVWAWQDDMIPVHYFNNTVGLKPDSPLENFIYNFTTKYVPSVNQLYYVLLLFFAVLFSIIYFRRRELDFGMEFIFLIIFGYFCLMLLSEAQSRYKCLIIPYICILSSLGIYQITKTVKERIKNGRFTLHRRPRLQ